MSYGDIAGAVGTIGGTAGSLASLFISREAGDDPGEIALSGQVLPGFTQSIRISRSWKIERVPIEGRAGALKLARYLQDAVIEVEQILLDDRAVGLVEDLAALATGNIGDLFAASASDSAVLTSNDKLLLLSLTHTRVDSDGLPIVYDVENEHFGARGVQKVLFETLDDGRRFADRVEVRLRFAEFAPVLIESVAVTPPNPLAAASADTSPF